MGIADTNLAENRNLLPRLSKNDKMEIKIIFSFFCRNSVFSYFCFVGFGFAGDELLGFMVVLFVCLFYLFLVRHENVRLFSCYNLFFERFIQLVRKTWM